jgi:phage-related protein
MVDEEKSESLRCEHFLCEHAATRVFYWGANDTYFYRCGEHSVDSPLAKLLTLKEAIVQEILNG